MSKTKLVSFLPSLCAVTIYASMTSVFLTFVVGIESNAPLWMLYVGIAMVILLAGVGLIVGSFLYTARYEMMNSLRAFFDPWSIEGLKKRAKSLPDCPYKLVMNLAVHQLEQKKITEGEAKKAIEYVRTSDPSLLKVGIGMLNLSQAEIDIALELLRKMK